MQHNIRCVYKRYIGVMVVEMVNPIRNKKKIDSMKMYLKGKNPRDYCLFTLGINSGLRVSDLLSLTVADVWRNGHIADRIVLHEQKTGKHKDFPISTSSKQAITEYLATRPNADEADPLFLSEKGGAIRRETAWRILNEAASAVGITDSIGTHTLRKTFGYHAYKQGTDITVLMKMMNHSSPGITLRYIGITQDQMDNVYLNLNL